MARPRKDSADNALPKYVSRGRSAFEYKPPASGSTIRLCKLDQPLSKVWEAYEKVRRDPTEISDFAALCDRFFSSADFIRLSKATKYDYRKKNAKRVLKPFGKMHPNHIKPEHIRQYMDRRGLTSTTQANRDKAFMSRVFQWGYERGMAKINPCQGVRQYTEIPRERYITDDEYNAVYAVADDLTRAAMELSYLCCARQGDVLSLRRDQINEGGIFIRQGKTGVRQIKAWSPRLLAAIELSKQLPTRHSQVVSTFVLRQANGDKYTASGFNKHWRKARAEAERANPELKFDFTFHDLKAKGISDLEGTLQEKQAISGHKTIEQTARYDRKVKIVPAVDGQRHNLSK